MSKIETETEKLKKLEAQLAAQKEKLTELKRAETIKARKASTHNKAAVGGAVLAILRDIRHPDYSASNQGYIDGYEKFDELAIADFLRQQERNGKYFSRHVEQWHAEHDARLEAEEASRREARNKKRREKRKADAVEVNADFFTNE